MQQLQGIAHVALTVTDLARSTEWYGRVLGWEMVFEGEGEGVRFRVGRIAGPALLGLRQYETPAATDFDPTRLGMDHLAFDGGTPAGLQEWERRFDELGVSYDPVQETPYGHVLNLKDPDGIALEIYAAPQQG